MSPRKPDAFEFFFLENFRKFISQDRHIRLFKHQSKNYVYYQNMIAATIVIKIFREKVTKIFISDLQQNSDDKNVCKKVKNNSILTYCVCIF